MSVSLFWQIHPEIIYSFLPQLIMWTFLRTGVCISGLVFVDTLEKDESPTSERVTAPILKSPSRKTDLRRTYLP